MHRTKMITRTQKIIFFEKLQQTLDNITKSFILLGDFNGRVSAKPEEVEKVIGRYG